MERKELGDHGEALAADYLKANGFKIVEKNFRCRLGEIDIIARKGHDLYFVEVRTKSSDEFGDPLETITLKKQRQVAKIASVFLSRKSPNIPCHFSAIGIKLGASGKPTITFIPDAFGTS